MEGNLGLWIIRENPVVFIIHIKPVHGMGWAPLPPTRLSFIGRVGVVLCMSTFGVARLGSSARQCPCWRGKTQSCPIEAPVNFIQILTRTHFKLRELESAERSKIQHFSMPLGGRRGDDCKENLTCMTLHHRRRLICINEWNKLQGNQANSRVWINAWNTQVDYSARKRI